MIIPFAEWRPDVAALNSKFAQDVLNVLCADGFYIPFPSLAPISPALPDEPVGGFTARGSGGSIVVFAGTKSKLMVLDGTTLTWTDVSRSSGGAYNATTEERWCFAQFGNYVIAVNVNDDPQVFEIGVSTRFAALAGSPPKARIVVACGDFLFLGNLASYPSRIHWSALNDITKWTPGQNNSDYQDFPDGGPVMGIKPATNPVIIQQSAIRFATFIPGSKEIFAFQKVHESRGAASRGSICWRGDIGFYVDSGGFFMLGGDGAVVPIGLEKIDRTFFAMVDFADVKGIVGAIDPFYNRVYWAAKTRNSVDAFDVLLVYDWALQRWSQASVSTGFLLPLSAATIGYTLESLDQVSASLDALPFSLDSRVWQGGSPVFAAFDGDRKLGFFSGPAAEAFVTTQEMGDTAGGVSRISEIMPVVDTSAVRISIGARFRRGDVPVWSAEVAPSSNTGIARKNSRSRFHQFKVRIPEGTVWTMAQGVDVKSSPAGMR